MLGAALRGTRFVVRDDVPGQLWIKEPLDAWLLDNGESGERFRRWGSYRDGLDCPFCVGQWVAFAVVGSYALVRRRRQALAVWRGLAGALTLNYVAAHIGTRLGDVAGE
jgi:hypothetical protein